MNPSASCSGSLLEKMQNLCFLKAVAQMVGSVFLLSPSDVAVPLGFLMGFPWNTASFKNLSCSFFPITFTTSFFSMLQYLIPTREEQIRISSFSSNSMLWFTMWSLEASISFSRFTLFSNSGLVRVERLLVPSLGFSWIYSKCLMLQSMVRTSFPEQKSQSRRDLSLRQMMRYFPNWLRLKLKATRFNELNSAQSVSILKSNPNPLSSGKSKVTGSHNQTFALSSTETHTPNFQFIFRNFTGCMCELIIFTTLSLTSLFSAVSFSKGSITISSPISTLFSLSPAGSITNILPDFSSLTATFILSLFSTGMNSQELGMNWSFTTNIKSQFRTSNILRVLSTETVQRRLWFRERLAPVTSPEWALKCLMNSMRLQTFFQNLR